MIDRHGNAIIIGWSAHHIAWIRAAMTLEVHAMREAFQDIADMTGRSYASIWQLRRSLQHEEQRLTRQRQNRKRLAEISLTHRKEQRMRSACGS